MAKQRDSDVNADHRRVDELLFEIKRLERRIQFYEKGFNAWDCLPKDSSLGSTRKKSSIKKKSDMHTYKHWNRGGSYSFETWLEDAKKYTLRPIPIVEVFFLEQVQSDIKQGNFVPIYSCSHYKEIGHVTFLCPKEKLFTLIEEEDKFIEKQIPKFDDRELVR